MVKRIKRSFCFSLIPFLFIVTFLPFPTTAESESESAPLNYVALGDSLAAGFLNGVPPEENLKGYPDFIEEGIQEEMNYGVDITNAGVGGYRTDNVYDDLKNNKDDIQKSVEEADVITLSAGANDVLQEVMDDLEDIDPDNPEEMEALVAKATDAVGQVDEYTAKILDEIEDTNPDADIYVLGYYNALPYLDELQDEVNLLINLLNNTIEDNTEEGDAAFIPTFDAFDGKHETYLPDPDDIHPTEEGYQVIADLFLDEMVASLEEIKPGITLNGDSSMEILEGDEYADPGAKAEDDMEGDISEAIEISGDVDTNEPGEYELTYSVENGAGNWAEASRTVTVIEAEEASVKPDEAIEIKAGNTVHIKNSNTSIKTPLDFPENIKLNVSDAANREEVGKNEGKVRAGDIYAFDFGKSDIDESTYTLEMGYDKDKYAADEVDVYYYNTDSEKWELQDTVDANEDKGTLTVEVNHFSMYGVFAADEGEEEGGVWFSGEGEPSDETGDIGDLYLDEETGDYYKKEEEGWAEKGNLKGKNGNDGNEWLVGEGEPEDDNGASGDLYLDEDSNDVYHKTEDGWEHVTNIKGVKGDEKSSGDCDCDDEDKDEESGVSKGSDGSDNDNDSSSTDTNKTAPKKKAAKMPNTASNIPLFLMIGSLMVIVGGGMLFVRRKVLQ